MSDDQMKIKAEIQASLKRQWEKWQKAILENPPPHGTYLKSFNENETIKNPPREVWLYEYEDGELSTLSTLTKTKTSSSGAYFTLTNPVRKVRFVEAKEGE